MFSREYFPNRRAVRQVLRHVLPVTLALGLALPLSGCKTSAEKAEEYYRSGLALLEQGDVDRAIVQFRNVFEVDGSHYDARKTLAEVHARNGKSREAYSQYLRLAEQYPDDLDVRIALARMAYDSGQNEEFARHAARAAELGPDNPDVKAINLALRYRNAVEADDNATRNSIADEARSMLGARPEDILLLSVLLDRAGRNKDMAELGPLIETLLRLQPDNRLRHQQKLAYLMEQGDMAALERQLLATIGHFPEDQQAKADLIRFYMSQSEPEKAGDYLRNLAEKADPADPAPRVDLIRFLQMQEGDAAALAEIERAVAAGGDPLVFRVLRAIFQFNAGETGPAIAEVQAVLEGVSEPSERSRDVRIELARMLLATGDETGARAEVEKVLAEDPAQPAALVLKAAWDIEADRTDDAILALRSVIDRQPENVEALGLMADAYHRSGEPDLARDYLGQAAKASNDAPLQVLRFARALAEEGRWRPAEDALLPALKLDPQNVDLLGLLGQVYLSMPDLPRASDVIRQLRGIGSSQANEAAEQLELARIGAADGQDAALSYLEELAGGADAGIAAKLSLVRAKLATGDSAGAQSLAAELAAADPESRQLQMVVAMTTAASGNLPGGQAMLQQLIDQKPDDPAPYLALLRLSAQAGDQEMARRVLEQGLAALPDHPDLLWARAGELESAGDVDGAIAIYERLYAQNSGSVIVANNLASLLATWHADDPAKVERASVVARRMKDTTVPALMDTYGWIQHLNGNSAAALPYLEGAATGLPEDPMVQIHLGLVQQALGEAEAAQAQLEKALALVPADRRDSAIETARAALEQLRSGAAARTGETVAGEASPSVSN